LFAQWDLQLKSRSGEFVNATTSEVQKYGTFCNLDLKVYWTDKNYELYTTFNNLTNHTYYDVANVKQPGMWFMGGIKIKCDL
jgi:iron complex outermembrane receptor protein